MHSDRLDGATAVKGVVVGVDDAGYTVDVRLEVGHMIVRQVELLLPWADVSGSGGVYALPQVNDHVLYLRPGRAGAQGYVIGGISPRIAGTGRAPASDLGMLPGDVLVRAADGGAVRLRRGGGVELECGEMCSVSLEPRREEVGVTGKHLAVELPGFSLRAETLDPSESPDGEHLSNVTLEVRDAAEDAHAAIELRAGHVADGSVARILVCDPASGVSGLSVDLSPAGDVTVSGDVAAVEARLGSVAITAAQVDVTAAVTATGNVTVNGTMSVTGGVTISGAAAFAGGFSAGGGGQVAGGMSVADDGDVAAPLLLPATAADLAAALTALMAALAPLGVAALPPVTDFIAKATQAAAGSGPYVTTRLTAA